MKASKSSNSLEQIRLRAFRFTDDEKSALMEAVRDRHDILFGKIPRLTKNVAWNEVLIAVNEVSSTERTLTQVIEKYKHLKKEGKYADFVKNKPEIKKPGGGSAQIPTAAMREMVGGIDSSDIGQYAENEIIVVKEEDIDTDFELDDLRTRPQSPQALTSSIRRQFLKRRKTKEIKTRKEMLLERQVELVEEQTQVLKDIHEELKLRNEIEFEKLKIKKKKYGLK